jgi:hypothetical protein
VLMGVGFLVAIATMRVTDWLWWGRIFNAVMITFICTEAAVVIVERDPSTGFGTTEIEVLTFDNWFLLYWATVAIVYVSLYYLSYRHLPWHADRQQDEKEVLWKQHQKTKKHAGSTPSSVVIPATPHPHDSHHHHHHHPHHPDTMSLLYPDLD